MADFNWDDFEDAEPTPVRQDRAPAPETKQEPVAQAEGFSWDSFEDSPDQPSEPKVSKITSAARGGAKGLTAGFSDEISGFTQASDDFFKSENEKRMELMGGRINPRTGMLSYPNGRKPKEQIEKELAEWKKNKDNFSKNYVKARDEARRKDKEAQEANPTTFGVGQFGGAILPTLIPGLGGASIGRLAVQGAAQGLGDSEAETLSGLARDTGIGAGGGVLLGSAMKGLSKIPFKKGISKVSSRAGKFLDEVAENKALNATGATRTQAGKFKPGTGRRLLDKEIVKFGRSPKQVEKAAEKVINKANAEIDDVLKQLDAQGVVASVDDVVGVLQKNIDELKQVPGNERLIGRLSREIDNLYLRGQSDLLPSVAEKAKRTFQQQTNYNSPVADQQASKRVASAFREQVEKVANSADDGLLSRFKTAKDDYGFLKPVQEAAEKRAIQLNQSPLMGFNDMVAGTTGYAGGGPVGAAASIGAKRLLAPRLSSSAAVSVDRISKLLKSSPETLGRFAEPLANAAARGGNSLAATDFILQQSDEEYRKKLLEIQEMQEEDE